MFKKSFLIFLFCAAFLFVPTYVFPMSLDVHIEDNDGSEPYSGMIDIVIDATFDSGETGYNGSISVITDLNDMFSSSTSFAGQSSVTHRVAYDTMLVPPDGSVTFTVSAVSYFGSDAGRFVYRVCV